MEPVRDYPEKNLASHTLGTMGKISEDELLKSKKMEIQDIAKVI
ncbi:hypothetical protein Q5M85_08610 [Paraclostridium bifermentans]|nr:hypothetical protein [Paraclostridium bifermentans]